MKKLFVISAALLLTAGGTMWAAVSLPSEPITAQQQDKTTGIASSTPSNTTPDPMGRRGRGRGHGGGGDHICGTRFCGQHCHHHGHVWCDGHAHWYCPGHH
ncbi:hypothetical protein [Roseimicrobium gellanilyticum]|uniref:hypothetical protein n=1 Tax=Roseimicrobium gellanilyticum TaxID=748857 RepID=UPI0011BF7278|nr:hypothetical protein [Roseimicrobium gellanilyticum]